MKSSDEMIDALKRFCANYEWKYEAAYHLHISPIILSGMLSGKRPITERVARKLGYTIVRMYKRANNG